MPLITFVILLISSGVVLTYSNFPLYAISVYGLSHVRHLPQMQYIDPRAQIRTYRAEGVFELLNYHEQEPRSKILLKFENFAWLTAVSERYFFCLLHPG